MPQCGLCRGAMDPWIKVPGDWRRPGLDEVYALYWCRACGFGQAHPRPANPSAAYEVEEYYTHTRPHPRRSSTPRDGLLDRLIVHLAWRADRGQAIGPDLIHQTLGGTSGRLLDVGCGNGELLEQVQMLGFDVLGIEPDASARAVAAARGLPVQEGSAESIDPESMGDGFDAVVMCHVLEHCPDPVRALTLAATALKPEGKLFVEVPNNAALGLQRSRAAWRWLDAPRHLNFFTATSLRRTFALAGLGEPTIGYCGYTRQFSREWSDAEARIREIFGLPAATHGSRWRLLARTLFAGPARKYDSVLAIAGR